MFDTIEQCDQLIATWSRTAEEFTSNYYFLGVVVMLKKKRQALIDGHKRQDQPR